MRAVVSSGGPRRIAGDQQLRERDEKLESLKVAIGKLAHDFNNFLVPHFGYVTLLKEEMPADSQSAQYLEALEEAGRHAEAYLDSILGGLQPHRRFSPVKFSFDALVNATLDAWSAETEMSVEVTREIEPCAVFGDEKHWQNSVLHLLENARQALATAGKLEVVLRRQTIPADEIERLGLNVEDVCSLRIRDNGCGMSGGVAARAFEPFFTTRKQLKAQGLGLTMVHSVAQFHGGQVELKSTPQEGTVVTVWIPVRR